MQCRTFTIEVTAAKIAFAPTRAHQGYESTCTSVKKEMEIAGYR